MANSTLTLTSSIIMIALFSIAIISFAIGFAADNNAAINIADDGEMSSLRQNTRSNISTFRKEVDDTYTSITKATVEPGSDVLQSSGSFTVTWGNLYGVFSNILDVINKKIFGNNPAFVMFLTALLSIIGFMFALYVIKTWRGNP